jgi:hypothetical protein
MNYPKFSLGTFTPVVFSRGIRYPVSSPIEVVQVQDRDAAGMLHVEDLGVVVHRMVLSFSHLPVADYLAAKYWFEEIAKGALNTFFYTDQEEVQRLVRWTSSVYDFVETSHGMYSGTIELEVVE